MARGVVVPGLTAGGKDSGPLDHGDTVDRDVGQGMENESDQRSSC